MPEQPTRPAWTRPLRVHLSVLLVALLLLVTLPQIWLSYQHGRKAADDAIDVAMAALSDQIIDHYRLTFSDKLTLVQIGSALESMRTAPPADLDEKRSYLFEVVTRSRKLDSIFAGYPEGRFMRMVGLGADSAWRTPLNAPEDAHAAMQTVVPNAEGEPQSRWTFLDATGKPVSVRKAEPTDYDPRQSDWYKQAVAAGAPVATKPYRMAATGQYVKTVADPHAESPGVVVAADIPLAAIGAFLTKERISAHSETYVFDDEGRLVVHSEPDLMAALMASARADGTPDSKALLEHDPLLPIVEKQLAKVGSGQAHFSLAGQTYELMFVPISFLSVLEGYTIAVAAPQSDFTRQIEEELRRELTIAGGILVAGLLLALFLSRAITRRLAQLTTEALRIKDLDFSDPPPVRSRISEIVSLASAIGAARTAIRSFGHYVPKELVNRIIASGLFDKTQARREEVTVLFTDGKDFTTISEALEPEEVVDMLSSYFEVINAGVEAHGGTIIQFIGDAVYAMWNAPSPDPDHAVNACRCALALEQSIDVFNAAQRAAGKPELPTRFGLHTGPAVVGNVGARDRLQYTGIGDTINVASRLEGLNKTFGTSILISRETRERCGEAFSFEAKGETTVKGRTRPVEVFALTAVAGSVPGT